MFTTPTSLLWSAFFVAKQTAQHMQQYCFAQVCGFRSISSPIRLPLTPRRSQSQKENTMTRTLAIAAAAILATTSVALADDLDFVLVNESSAALIGFNVSPASSNNWEENLLGGDRLASGYEVDVVIADGLTTCIYDIRGQFPDGAEFEDYGVDLCDLGEYTFTD